MTTANFRKKIARSQNGTVQAPRKAAKSSKGFSLIELMIVVAIIGIVSAIGYPSYLDYIKKTRRADGHLALMNASQSLERCKATNFSFTNCTLPEDLTESDEGDYAISLEVTATTYIITATAQNKQANDDKCPTMILNDKGQQTFTGDGPCW